MSYLEVKIFVVFETNAKLLPKLNTTDGLVKSSVCKARDPGKAEAYFLYVEGFHGERNAADGLFYEPVK